MSSKIHLLIIDPQNDFCDIPREDQPYNPLIMGERLAPALPVPGAHDDMLRLATFIHRVGRKIHDIHVTLDSHNPVDIAHPTWWRNDKGENPAPFTIITAQDVRNGIWKSRNPQGQQHSLKYVEALEANGRYQLIIWPEHCLIGSWGHNVHAAVFDSLTGWARNKLEVVNFVTKGSNATTEHYSAVQAEVPDPSDPSTTLNSGLIQTLSDADIIVIAGEALSHCVASTINDIANNFGEENIKKFVLLEDCCSSVAGFEHLGKQFVDSMVARGMKVARSTEFLA